MTTKNDPVRRIICPVCEGQGILEYPINEQGHTVSRDCYNCRGRYLVDRDHVTVPKTLCPDCVGWGWVDGKCARCNGTGHLVAGEAAA